MWMELYDREQMAMLESAPPGDVEPLAPLELEVGQEIQLAVRYSGLSHMNSSGIQNLAFSFDYNANYLELQEFGVMDLDIGVSEMDSPDELYRWGPESLQSYLPSASVRTTEEEGIYRVYLQYIADSERTTVLREEDAIVGVFTFTVSAPIAVRDQVFFSWTDYLASFYGPDETDLETYENYSKVRFTDSENFEPPQDLQIATGDSGGDEGWTISGVVESYNAKNPITYELYRMGDDGEYTTNATYTGTAVEAQATTSAAKQIQTFSISGVETGQYKLVIKKSCHLDFTVLGVNVVDSNLDLQQDSRDRVQSMVMGAGDVDGNGNINYSDANIVTNINNYNKLVATGVRNEKADIDGNGNINFSDKNIITNALNYNKSNKDFVIEAVQD